MPGNEIPENGGGDQGEVGGENQDVGRGVSGPFLPGRLHDRGRIAGFRLGRDDLGGQSGNPGLDGFGIESGDDQPLGPGPGGGRGRPFEKGHSQEGMKRFRSRGLESVFVFPSR